jgi:hypothetical protein
MRLNDPVSWSAALEGGTALALVLAPSVVARLLFAVDAQVVAVPLARIAGIALLSLVIACVYKNGARRALLIYNVLVGGYLLILGLSGYAAGILLWPVVVIHGVMALLLMRDSARRRLGGGT